MNKSAFDARFVAACIAAGTVMDGYAGIYRTPDGDETPINYLFDEERMIDSGSPEAGVSAYVRSRQIGLQLAEVAPAAGGVVVGSDGRRWRLTQLTGERDDSMQWWACAPVRGDGA